MCCTLHDMYYCQTAMYNNKLDVTMTCESNKVSCGNRLQRRQGLQKRRATWLARPPQLPKVQPTSSREPHPWYNNKPF